MRTLVFAILAACGGGGGHPAPVHPVERAPAHVEPAADPRASSADCDRLIAHVIELDDHAARLADADREAVRAKLQSELGAECRTKPRAIVMCGIDAPTSEALANCDQAMRSSSTSNSSVAPGGIAPGAPRSP